MTSRATRVPVWSQQQSTQHAPVKLEDVELRTMSAVLKYYERRSLQ
jgi:hypothetical protein